MNIFHENENITKLDNIIIIMIGLYIFILVYHLSCYNNDSKYSSISTTRNTTNITNDNNNKKKKNIISTKNQNDFDDSKYKQKINNKNLIFNNVIEGNLLKKGKNWNLKYFILDHNRKLLYNKESAWDHWLKFGKKENSTYN